MTTLRSPSVSWEAPWELVLVAVLCAGPAEWQSLFRFRKGLMSSVAQGEDGRLCRFPAVHSGVMCGVWALHCFLAGVRVRPVSNSGSAKQTHSAKLTLNPCEPP